MPHRPLSCPLPGACARRAVLLGSWSLALMLSACGGGGSSGSASPTPPALPALSSQCEAQSVARLDTEALTVGRSSEVHLVGCNSSGAEPFSELRWRVSGPGAPLLLSGRSPSLSLTPQQAGTLRFAIDFKDALGRSHSGSVDLAVAPNDLPRGVLTRGEPSVWAGGTLSLRAWPQGYSSAELVGASLRWTRVSGPALALDGNASSQAALVFNAPSVSTDQVLTLRATLSWPDGRAASDDFRLLVQPVPRPAADPLFSGSSAATRVLPYRDTDNPWLAPLQRCVYSPALQWSPNNLCTLAELPILGQGGVSPSVEQVMQRVLVSHDWMGEVFERYLREQDPDGDVRRLLASATAVVIGARIRPAFYWSATGAIYLDASYLWTTPEQRDTLSEAADPRSNYGRDLSYSSPWRYVKDNRHASPARPVAERGSRSLEELRPELFRLMVHELTHAADFLPPRVHAVLNPARKVYESIPADTPSEQLLRNGPLLSGELFGLGRVLFFGEASNATQRSYTPEQVAGFFANDRANDDYSYALPAGASVPREDAAMLAEEALLQLRLGIQRDLAFTPRVPDGGSSADQPVVWGVRGRIGEPLLRPRLRAVLQDTMPWVTAAELDRLPAPLLLRPGLTWGQNLDQAALTTPNAAPRALSAGERLREAELSREQALRRH